MNLIIPSNSLSNCQRMAKHCVIYTSTPSLPLNPPAYTHTHTQTHTHTHTQTQRMILKQALDSTSAVFND